MGVNGQLDNCKLQLDRFNYLNLKTAGQGRTEACLDPALSHSWGFYHFRRQLHRYELLKPLVVQVWFSHIQK